MKKACGSTVKNGYTLQKFRSVKKCATKWTRARHESAFSGSLCMETPFRRTYHCIVFIGSIKFLPTPKSKHTIYAKFPGLNVSSCFWSMLNVTDRIMKRHDSHEVLRLSTSPWRVRQFVTFSHNDVTIYCRQKFCLLVWFCYKTKPVLTKVTKLLDLKRLVKSV